MTQPMDSTGYKLIPADARTYSKQFATYRKNVWFRPSWDALQEMMKEATNCYWIVVHGTRVAGVTLTDKAIGSLFLFPPYEWSSSMATFLKEHIVGRSSGSGSIYAYNVLPEHLSAFEAEGFKPLPARKCMIRPTEQQDLALASPYICIPPEPTQSMVLAELMKEAYRRGTDERPDTQYKEDIDYYFKQVTQETLRDASSILVNQDTNEIVGLCLVSLWEELPLIYEIAVKPAYRGQGLGKYMLRRAVHQLNDTYSVLRLFVTSGNAAEKLYSNLGFLSGDELTDMIYSMHSKG
ncbi:GNAT family N-acetyltransferase [Paenibacillus thiaminolyticus]|uniref:GNAT family N-acetyltransferase n=1 Tax=Paenibacillus thiaminolyticus TaxID=49283 RepID=UPI003D29F631